MRGVLLALSVLSANLYSVAQSVAHNQDQPSLQQFFDRAQSLQASGEREQAIIAYRLFLSNALERMAGNRHRIGDHALAAQQLAAASSLLPDDLSLLRLWATAERDADHLEIAKELADKWITAQSRNADAYALRGSILAKLGQTDDEIRDLERAVELDPTLDNGFALAKAYLHKKDEPSAARLFAEMLASTGDTAAIHMDIGRTYGVAGYPDQAIEEFKKALAKDGTLPGLHYSLGASYLLSMGEIDFPQASAEFHRELDLHPDDFLSHAQLGYIALNRHEYATAEQELSRAAELNPHDPDTFVSLGQLYVDTSRPADAETALRKAIALTTDPSRNHYQVQRAHYLLGRILMQTGRTEQAKAEMQISTDLLKLSTLENQGRPAAEIADRARVLHLQQPDASPFDAPNMEPVAAFEKQLAPVIAESYNNLGVLAAQGDNFTAAMDYFTHAAQWRPDLDGLDYNLGRAAYSAKAYARAVQPLGNYLLKHPGDLWFRVALGVSLYSTGDAAGAVATLRPMEPSLPSLPAIEYLYAAAEVETGAAMDGIARLTRLEAAQPKKTELHRMLGKAYLRVGDMVHAEAELRSALRLDPGDTESRHWLSDLLLKQGKQPAAAATSE